MLRSLWLQPFLYDDLGIVRPAQSENVGVSPDYFLKANGPRSSAEAEGLGNGDH